MRLTPIATWAYTTRRSSGGSRDSNEARAPNTAAFAALTMIMHQTDFSRSRGAVLQLEQPSAACDERSTVQPARPKSRSSLPAVDRQRVGRRSRHDAGPSARPACSGPSRPRSRATTSARSPCCNQNRRRPPGEPMRTAAEATPLTALTRLVAMKSTLRYIGGPVMPRSNSRAVVRSSARSGSSRCPMPGGCTQA